MSVISAHAQLVACLRNLLVVPWEGSQVKAREGPWLGLKKMDDLWRTEVPHCLRYLSDHRTYQISESMRQISILN